MQGAMESGKKTIPSLSRLIQEEMSQVLKDEQQFARQTGLMDEERSFSRRKERPVPRCRSTRKHSFFGEWKTVVQRVSSGEQQGTQLNKGRNQELTFYCTVNHWRILIRKVTLPVPHVTQSTRTTIQKGLKAGRPHQKMKAGTREIDIGCLVVKVRNVELELLWHSTMALGDTDQGHYVRKEKH